MITIYKANTGKILRNVDCPESMKEIQLQDNELYIEGNSDSRKQYVNITMVPPLLTNRPIMDIAVSKYSVLADSSDSVLLSKLPTDCLVTIGDDIYTVPDNSLELSLTLPGIYIVKIIKFPWLDKEVTIEGIT